MTPRIRTLTIDDAAAESRAILQQLEKSLGRAPNLHRTLAQSPASLAAYVGFAKAMSTGVLSQPLREKIALTTAAINDCGYCSAAHTMLGKAAGIPDHEIKRNLKAESADRKDAAALAFVSALIENGGDVEDSEFDAVRAAGFKDGEIVEIAANVALNGFSNLINRLARTTIDFPVADCTSHSN